MERGKIIKIGISGKRGILPEERQKVRMEIGDTIRAMLKKHHSTQFVGYTALASGADSVFAEVVGKDFRQPLHVILPFALEEYEKDFEGDDLDIFRNFIKEEEGRYEIAEAIVPEDGTARNAAYYKAGIKIADECDEMVIVWDGLRPGGTGGTAEILGYSSETKGGAHVGIVRIRPVKPDPLHGELTHKYERANDLAIKARDKYKLVWKSAIFLGWLTVACFACKTAFHLEELPGLLLTLSEFLFVVSVYVLVSFAKRNNYHGHYLRERMKAETCRLLLNFYHAGVRVDISTQSKEEGTMTAASAEHINQRLRSGEGSSKWYTQYVIKSLIHEQCSYHTNKVKSIGDKHAVYERFKDFLKVFFIVNLGAHLVHVFIAHGDPSESWPYELSVFFNILLPASYAALEGVTHFSEWTVLKKYSGAARQNLTEAEDMLPDHMEELSYEECHKKQAKVLHRVSLVMLTDNKNWNSLLESKNDYHLFV